MNNIPPVDLAKQYEIIADELNTAVLQVLGSGRYIGGALVKAFEQQFGRYIGTTDCVACNSGTDALFLALRALDIGPGDEVITTPFTFIATAEVINAVGATPVFVDIDAGTFNLDMAQIEAVISERTRAIIPVHLFGQPVDMTRLMAIAQAHNLFVIEDCAQAAGAEWAGQKVGSIGHIGCFSFFPTKNLGACGDGGAVTTQDPELAAAMRMIADHGRKELYYHEKVGINSRLDALQAAILQIKLRYLDSWNQQRSQAASYYQQLLEPMPNLVAPQALAGGKSVWNYYTIRLTEALDYEGDANRFGGNFRDRVRSYLQQQGVVSMVYYPLPLHLQPVYAYLGYCPGQLPVAEQAANQVLSLPMFPELSLEQQQQVVYNLKNCLVQPVA
ncbi:MAG: DegT/DnrJ/EryC1/StrS family aminotransferase [Cyanothece sp. SIO1E1]|nr:DegT/DnrJ/EryC1/StrS family aminotransferase [Cyanothece sp. SIO1E1]